jgi:hypothetical protein
VTDDKGESRISFADYAIAMVDELEQHRYPRAVHRRVLNGRLLGISGRLNRHCERGEAIRAPRAADCRASPLAMTKRVSMRTSRALP